MPAASAPPASPYRVLRLGPAHRDVAKRMFAVMAEGFDEEHEELSSEYVDKLLARDDFWAVAALEGEEVVGGLTAHTLLMTREEAREIFIYDIAVHPQQQRKGIGSLLMRHLLELGAEAGIGDVFVPADNADPHALDFYRAVGGTAVPVTFFTFSRDSA